ncbi:MAG: ATP-binding cassette domain-containing protein [Clostridia bacterium]|nr:ATP-binding cassette domain-containing protein [Clostridia bacterium]
MIRTEHLNKTYDRRSKHANHVLHDVSFTLPDTGFVCIVGPSGCGKTSLLNAIGGLDVFDNGTIATENATVTKYGTRALERERNSSFGYIFQNYYLLGEHSVAYNVYLGLHALALPHAEKLARVEEALKAVHMERYARRAVADLSGGQQQRVAIARALARRPRVIFADEPTGNLDEENTVNICSLLRQISRTSLVVMVTHEERIARFFADRIITLKDGRIAADESGWQRDDLLADTDTFYTGDYRAESADAEHAAVRVLYEEGAEPIELTVVVRKDRVVLKLDDARTVSYSRLSEPPHVVDGERPKLELETIENSVPFLNGEGNPTTKAGKGLPFSLLWGEARNLIHSKTTRKAANRIFLVLLALVTLLAVGDYAAVSAIDPRDFITTDSHVLAVELERDLALGTAMTMPDLQVAYREHIKTSNFSFRFLPRIVGTAMYRVDLFLQLGSLSESLSAHSCVPIDTLDEADLIYGRMPQNGEEIVVDRWILDELIARDGIIQSSLNHISDLLGQQLHFSRKNYAPTIVGISDSGEPSLYVPDTYFACLGTLGCEVITLSELQAKFPGAYDDRTLGEEECFVITNNAGAAYAQRIGGVYSTAGMRMYTIRDAFEADTYAAVVIPDAEMPHLLESMLTDEFFLYCEDKDAMKAYLDAGVPPSLKGCLTAEIEDAHSDAWEVYLENASMRMDARRIVTLTVIALSMLMLWLLQRARVSERLGMVAVYRLLGIPGRKLATIFALECVRIEAKTVLPVAVSVWAILAVLARTSLKLPLLLPWYAALAVTVGIFAFHLAASLFPLRRLLHLPPAQLAAKYDL